MESLEDVSERGVGGPFSETLWSEAVSLSSPFTLATSSSSHREFHSSMASPLTTSSTFLFLSFMSLSFSRSLSGFFSEEAEAEAEVKADKSLLVMTESTDLIMSLYGNDDDDDVVVDVDDDEGLVESLSSSLRDRPSLLSCSR